MRVTGTGDARRYTRSYRGLTLIELMLAVGLVAILAHLAMVGYGRYVERARVAQAVQDIAMLSTIIAHYQRDTGSYPPDLAAVGNAGKLDPWGRPYRYQNLSEKDAAAVSRRDKNMNPLNSDFDLFSLGKDGVSKKQISNQDSLDDVIRANDGAFIDLASKFVR